MVFFKTSSRRPPAFAWRMELIPRSDNAKLIDFVKFNGVVEGSRRSIQVSESDIPKDQNDLYISCGRKNVKKCKYNLLMKTMRRLCIANV